MKVGNYLHEAVFVFLDFLNPSSEDMTSRHCTVQVPSSPFC